MAMFARGIAAEQLPPPAAVMFIFCRCAPCRHDATRVAAHGATRALSRRCREPPRCFQPPARAF